MPKALAFGAFDGLHPGHRFYLDESAKLGDLTVVVGRDVTIEKVKGQLPLHDETARLQALLTAGYHAVLGSMTDRYAIFADVRPDFICLGYDQQAAIDKIEEACSRLGLSAKIVRIEAYKPEVYKSSLLNNNATPDRHK
jgi:FAD synthetase